MFTTFVVPYKPDFGELKATHINFHVEQLKQSRQSMLSEIRCISGFPELVHSLNQETLYKVVMPEGKLLQQGKDGLFRGVFYGDKGIEQHAQFVKVGPKLMDVAKSFGSQYLLISIAMQLNRIEKAVEQLSIEMHRDRIAEIHSGVDQFENAMLFKDLNHRKNAILNAIQTLHTGLQKTISELKDRIQEAPEPENSILYHLVPWNNKIKKATNVLTLALESFNASIIGIKTLSECYAALNETNAAGAALCDYFEKVWKCNIFAAAEKSRLLEFSGPIAPQEPWESYIRTYPSMIDLVRSFFAQSWTENSHAIEIEFMPHELKGKKDANLS